MADFDVGDVIRLGCVMKYDGLYDVVNVFHTQIEAGPGWTFAAATASFQAYCNAMYAYISDIQSDLITDDHIAIKNVTQGQVWGAVAWNGYTGGAAGGDPTATQLALLGWGRTRLSRVQIRKYFGVFTEVQMEAGLWVSAARTAVDDLMGYFVTSHALVGTMTVRGCAYRYDPVRVTFADSVSTSAIPVIQRRRRLGRGS